MKGKQKSSEKKGAAGRDARAAVQRIRVALTGVANPIMAHLCAILDRDPGVEALVLLDVIRPPHDLERARFVQVDLTMPDADRSLIEIFEREEITTVVHGAFLANPARDPQWAHELEAIGSLHVLDACAATGVRHVLLRSTTMVYGAHHTNPAFIREDHPLRATKSSRWIRDKTEADIQFQRFGEAHADVRVTIARMATVLAPSVTHYLARLLARRVIPLPAGYDPLMQFLDLDDSARALAVMVTAERAGVYNIVPKGVLPMSSVLRLGRRRPLPIPHPLLFGSARLLWRAQLMDVPPRFLDYYRYPWVADGTKAERELGFVALNTTRDVVSAFYRGTDQSHLGSGDVEVSP